MASLYFNTAASVWVWVWIWFCGWDRGWVMVFDWFRVGFTLMTCYVVIKSVPFLCVTKVPRFDTFEKRVCFDARGLEPLDLPLQLLINWEHIAKVRFNMRQGFHQLVQYLLFHVRVDTCITLAFLTCLIDMFDSHHYVGCCCSSQRTSIRAFRQHFWDLYYVFVFEFFLNFIPFRRNIALTQFVDFLKPVISDFWCKLT